MATTNVNNFSVDEWHRAEHRLTIVLLDLSGSTQNMIQREEAAGDDCSPQTVLSYSKNYIMKLAPVLCTGRVVIIGCANRCDVPTCRASSPFCQCQDSQCTRVLFRSEGPCEPTDIFDAIDGLNSGGHTYVAGPIVALPTVALNEMELQRRTQAQEQSVAFLMGHHPRLGETSPIRMLPHDVMQCILRYLGASSVHARVIMVIDGDNNVSCGRPSCSVCSACNETECPLAHGPEAVTTAVQRLISGSEGVKINCELNITMVGQQANDTRTTQKLRALCTATGGRYDAVAEERKEFVAQTFNFFDTTVKHPPSHVQARKEAVNTYMDLVRARKVLDCGVKTVFVGEDQATLEKLNQADEGRVSLCEKINGEPCTHGEDRAACLRNCQKKLTSRTPFANGTSPGGSTRNKIDHLSELLDSCLFVAQTCRLMLPGSPDGGSKGQ